MLDVKMYKWKPSIQVAAAIYTANKILKRSHAWSSELADWTGYEEKYVRSCAKELCKLVHDADEEKPGFKELVKKFSHSKFLEVAKICP
jgi:hypothetical protein